MITLIFLGLLLWQAWEDKHSPQVESETAEQSNFNDNNVMFDSDIDVPKPPTTVNKNFPINQKADEALTLERMDTDVFSLGFNPMGGLISELSLRQYPTSIERPEDFVNMLNTSDLNFFAYQNGLAGNENLPNHNSLFNLESIGF